MRRISQVLGTFLLLGLSAPGMAEEPPAGSMRYAKGFTLTSAARQLHFPATVLGCPEMTPAEAIAELARALALIPAVKRVVLFGSRARGDNYPRSDIDLAVSMPGGTAADWQQVVDAAESVKTLLTIDLVRWEEAPADLKARVASEGEVLLER